MKSGFDLNYLLVDHAVSAAYAYDVKSGEWISFDDPASVAAKARYLTTHRLGGLMMWEIGDDAPAGSRWSLLDAAHRALRDTGPP